MIFFSLLVFSEHSHYGTSGDVNNLKCPSLDDGLNKVIRNYAVRGFLIIIIVVDMNFKALKDHNLVGVHFNACVKEDYAHLVKLWNNTVKERSRLYHTMITIKCLPRTMVVQLLIAVASNVSAFV